MPPTELALQRWRDGATGRVPDSWRAPLVKLGIAWIALFLLFAHDWTEMVRQWLNSSTYNHMLFVPFICGWLVAMRRAELARIAPCGWWPGLIFVTGALFLWLLGGVSETNTARHLGAVLAVQGATVALLGPRLGAGLLFPLGYLFFLVPFGDELVPQMQMVTAHITIALVEVSGIPARIDGVFIDTPAGLFEVAEACSGVKFLVAMAALGALMAHLCFKSWRRRLAFMAAALLVPVLANGVRAWGTIHLAQSIGAEAATGLDHIIYGWFFFAAVMALLALAARPFFDRPATDRPIDADAIMASSLLARLERGAMPSAAALAAIIALALAAIAWAGASAGQTSNMPRRLLFPEVPGWQMTPVEPNAQWAPLASGASLRGRVRYGDENGREIDLFLAVYSGAEGRAEPGGYGEGALVPDSGWSWLGDGPQFPGGKSEYLLYRGQVKRLAVTHYRMGDVLTASALRLRLAMMQDRLLLRRRPVAVMIVSARDDPRADAARSVEAFLRAVGPAGQWMDRAQQRP